MDALIIAGRTLRLTPAALIHHVRTRTDPANATRWARFWAWMTALALSPLIYLLMSQAKGIRYGLLRGLPLFGPADWFVALGTKPGGQLTAVGLVSIVVLFGGTLLATAFTLGLYNRYRQRVSDLRAEAIYRAATDGRTPEPFVLYLRPFVSTGAHKVRVNLGKAVREYDLEHELSRACAPIGRCIAIGESLEHLGAGRVSSSDEAWKTAIAALMHHAQLIVMLPSARPGTQWELEQIATSNLIAKTVFIDAPNTSATGYRQDAEWGKIGSVLARHGYTLPPDDPKGRVIAFGASKTPLLVEPLSFVGAQMLRGALDRALALNQPSGAATARHRRSFAFSETGAGALVGILVGSAALGVLAGEDFYGKIQDQVRSKRRTASVPAQFEPGYRHLSGRHGSDLGWAVSYHFVVEGRSYIGEDTITQMPIVVTIFDEPKGGHTTAYYEPSDPTNNQVEGHKARPTFNLIVEYVVVGSAALLCALVFFLACRSAARRVFARA